MPQEPPKSRPEPPRPRREINPQPGPPVYGDQWGGSGKQNPTPPGALDRPEPIETPREHGKK